MKPRPTLALALLFSLFLSAAVSAQSGTSGAAAAEEPTVTGVEVARANGGFLGLAIEGNAFVLRFYDKEKAEVKPDAIRATVRWNSPQKAGQQRSVLAADGAVLRSPPVVRPPLSFIAFVTLIGPDEKATDSFAFNLRTLE